MNISQGLMLIQAFAIVAISDTLNIKIMLLFLYTEMYVYKDFPF